MFQRSSKGLVLIIKFMLPWACALMMRASVPNGISKLGAKVKMPGMLEKCLRQDLSVDLMQVDFIPWLNGDRLPEHFDEDWIPSFRGTGERFQIRLVQLPKCCVERRVPERRN
jgi:hypothetical protein